MAKHKGPRRPPPQKKPPLTHFLCLPLVTPASRPQLETSMKKFKDAETPKASNAGDEAEKSLEQAGSTQNIASSVIHPKAIRPVGSLHCTLGVMSLDKDKLSKAVECLNTLDVNSLLQNAVKAPDASSESGAPSKSAVSSNLTNQTAPGTADQSTKPIDVNLRGLVSMHAPESTSILYSAPEDSTGRLYPFCLALQKIFKDAGFLVEDNRQLKLHATIVNTVYAKGRKRPQRGLLGQPSSGSSGPQAGSSSGTGEDGGHGPNANNQLKINATSLLEKYKNFVWAEDVVLDRVAICEMGAKKILDSAGNVIGEEYTEVATIGLPTSQDVAMSGIEQ